MINIIGMGAIGSLLACKFHLKCLNYACNFKSFGGFIRYSLFDGRQGLFTPNKSRNNPIKKLVVATKANDALNSLETIHPLLAPDASILFLQNGLGFLEPKAINKYSQQILISNLSMAAAFQDGILTEASNGGTLNVTAYNSNQQLNNNSNSLLSTLSQLDGIKVHILDTPTFQHTAHLKLTANCAINALATLQNCRNALNYNSTHTDIHQRRKPATHTEVEFLNGYIINQARIKGISTPNNQRLYDEFMHKFK
ncbi:hypothetical protein E3P86_02988 [Wallemia ichthyophaga]|uniref:2-dehydropantoate 2-reductase n=1 Tax=Wallemia ichthyophaga TaxID=245174 RepID=A0A4T0ITW4_WALIC|nr:hypothetical protein E3P86_02988 [Wallemia ichthyophaga]